MRDDVAALYVDPRGPYPLLVRDWYGEARDARTYAGPMPIVAHPPCGPWGGLRHLYRGTEHDCAPRAVAQVRRYGGVLEHPAKSTLFGPEPLCVEKGGERQHCVHWWEGDAPCCRCGLDDPLPLPGERSDRFGGYTISVDQVEWGHVARKKTWLYIVGVGRDVVDTMLAQPPYPGREPTHWCSGGGTGRGRVPPGVRVCSAQQRRRTPPAFAAWLLELASRCRRGRL